MSAESELRSLRLLVDEQSTNLTRLVRALEQDDRLRERADAAAQKESDRRHEALLEALDVIRRSNEAIGVALRDLPERCVRFVEAKIYELRTAKWEAQRAGVPTEPALLPPPPVHREPTGKIIALVEGRDPESVALTAAQQRWIVRAGEALWKWKVVHVGGGMILAHWIWERAYALVEFLKHAH